ncbi:MAG: MBOAT family O-acyltransferase [Gammaproteobacteria bacterium]|nr:membrane-bound O-acyltransferase family protein [Gammaproteobacteria bacterium]
MIFNSYVFWAFYALVLFLYWRLPHRAQNRLLLVASYVFYGYWDWRFLSLLAISTLIDYYVSHAICRQPDQRVRRRLLVFSIVANLGILGYFKYAGFFVREFADLLEMLGFQANLPVLNIVLPVGISFYTFQTMAYTIDVYRGVTKPAASLLDFALFVAFFPQLVAGPIERSSRLLPQLIGPRSLRSGDFAEGLYHILIGLLKKVVIADNLAPIVERVFSTPTAELTSADVLIGVYAFAFQIYGDFSGYSSIAQGTAKWLGIDLSYNFKMPYFSRSPSEFWRRWHITLSQWLRDYLYIPLGGNRCGVRRTYINLTLTMLLGGLWHGAAWTFVIWGAWHGLLLVAYRLVGMEKFEGHTSAWVAALQMVLMFHLVCIGWLFFRAESFDQAIGMIATLATAPALTDYAIYGAAMIVFFAGPLMIYEWYVYRSGDMLLALRRPAWQRCAAYGYCLVMLLVFPPLVQQVFIYFQF